MIGEPQDGSDIQLDELVEYMFVKNEDTKIDIDLQGVGSNKDAFCFFVDLLVKGLRRLYGGPNNVVNLDDLTVDQLQYIQTKFMLAGIVLKCSVADNEYHLPPCVNSRDIQNYADNAPLDTYVFQVIAQQRIYCIGFEIQNLK